MSKRQIVLWFRVITLILIGFGLVYVFFGLKIFSNNVKLIPHNVLLNWESALYGAIMTGWGVTLLLVGKIAFKQQNKELKRALVAGLATWLLIEAAASAWFGVWFNVGVDAVVFALFAVPLLRLHAEMKRDTK